MEGPPASLGSKRIGRRRDGRPLILDVKDAGLRSWQDAMRASMRLSAPREPLTGPVRVTLTIILARPKSHFRTGKHAGHLKADAPSWHVSKPDADKITRATLDCGTGLWWRDDAQCCEQKVTKTYTYASGPGMVRIWAEEMTG